jgi:hypothetical protein
VLEPFPDPLSPLLDVLVRHLSDAVWQGQLGVEEAIRAAAETGWYEGHIEGEDRCPGCHYRGDDPAFAARLRAYRG